jgi:DNA-binding IclR family transcriptional regulator
VTRRKGSGSSAILALRVLKALKGHSLDGLSNKELARGLGESAVNITRALAVLAEEGFVAQLPTGRWAHSVALLQIAQAHAEHVDGTLARIRETTSRIAAGAMD